MIKENCKSPQSVQRAANMPDFDGAEVDYDSFIYNEFTGLSGRRYQAAAAGPPPFNCCTILTRTAPRTGGEAIRQGSSATGAIGLTGSRLSN